MMLQVDEDCRESCEFLREVADWLADTRAPDCPDADGGRSSRLCTSRCSSDHDCLPDEMCCSTDHCGRSCVRRARPLTSGLAVVLITDHFSGPGRAIGSLCVRLRACPDNMF